MMLPTFIAIIAISALIIVWAIATQRKLVVLDENTRSDMIQIGVQLSSRFTSLNILLDLTKEYTIQESETLIESITAKRNMITANSTVDEVIRQERIISDVLERIGMIMARYPELKNDQYFVKTMNAAETFEAMMRTTRLIYNSNVTKLNREVRIFPTSMIAGMIGILQKEYLEE